ncbi:MAG: hypothetical protein SNF33_07635 [Candidatus Algichlamydia australiensis]|nr:hypothetical protein [Chlamydiales bacterium]
MLVSRHPGSSSSAPRVERDSREQSLETLLKGVDNSCTMLGHFEREFQVLTFDYGNGEFDRCFL